MDEKQIYVLSDLIVKSIVDFSMGRGKMKALIPRSVAKKMAGDAELFENLKNCYVEYLSSVDNKVNETSEVKRLTDFRYKLVDIFNATVPEGEVCTDEEE